MSLIITFQSSPKMSKSAILFNASFQSFFTLCSIILNGVSKKPYLSTFAYDAKCKTSPIFGHSGVAIGQILPY
ncbi:MAG: hypothetical protein LBU14_02195 [Candidatus Peribacteria bacterium]|nr:hypothetical protein [Candidatus Peribacteria bacterium]